MLFIFSKAVIIFVWIWILTILNKINQKQNQLYCPQKCNTQWNVWLQLLEVFFLILRAENKCTETIGKKDIQINKDMCSSRSCENTLPSSTRSWDLSKGPEEKISKWSLDSFVYLFVCLIVIVVSVKNLSQSTDWSITENGLFNTGLSEK